jgi:4,5-dihydroxyphthalate decarboxylase
MPTLELNLACVPTDRSRPILDGSIEIPGVRIKPLPGEPEEIFRRALREEAFDITEMSMSSHITVTARRTNAYTAVPVFLSRAFRHSGVFIRTDRGISGPADLKGKRIGIRSFTTTTGAWIRGILANDYGVDLDSIRWITFEDPHVAEYVDTTQRAPAGGKIIEMLLAGELDAVLGERSDDARLATLFADPVAEAKAWYDRNRTVPINHVVVVSEKLAKERPDQVREVFRMLKASKAKMPAPSKGDIVFCPFGLQALRGPLELIVRYAAQQGLIPRAYAVDELFDDTTRLLT